MTAVLAPITRFWRGEVPLARAFWLWGVLGGGIVNLSFSILALSVLSTGAPSWLALAVFVTPIPWNLVLLLGVWRSSERAEVRKEHAQMARLAMVVWVVALSVL